MGMEPPRPTGGERYAQLQDYYAQRNEEYRKHIFRTQYRIKGIEGLFIVRFITSTSKIRTHWKYNTSKVRKFT